MEHRLLDGDDFLPVGPELGNHSATFSIEPEQAILEQVDTAAATIAFVEEKMT